MQETKYLLSRLLRHNESPLSIRLLYIQQATIAYDTTLHLRVIGYLFFELT